MKNINKKIIILVVIVFIFSISFYHQIYGADYDHKLESPLPGPGKPLETTSNPAEYIKYLFIFGLSIVGATAVSAFVIGAFIYLASGGNESAVRKGKEWMWGAILGILLLLGSYLILSTIYPGFLRIGIRSLNFSGESAPAETNNP